MQATEVAYEDGQLAKVLGLLLERGEIGGKVSIGLDPALDFLSTARADNPAQLEAQSQLSERLGSRLPGGVASCENPVRRSKVKVKSLMLFPRRIGNEVVKAFSGLGRSHFSLVSTSHALMSLCAKVKAAPRKWRNHIRIAVGPQEAAALLITHGTVIARQTSPLQKEDPAPGIRSLVQRLAAAAEKELDLGEVQGVILHADADLAAAIGPCTEGLSAQLIHAPAVSFDRGMLAAMLGNCKWGRGGPLALDSVVQVEGERPSFPTREALPVAAGIVGLGAWLWMQGNDVLAQVNRMDSAVEEICLEREISREELIDAKDGMMIEVGLAEAFLMDRVYWSQLLAELPALVPDAVNLSQVEGKYAFSFVPQLDEEDGEDNAEPTGPDPRSRWLNLVGQIPVPDVLQVPPEARQFTAALKASPVISKPFPTVSEPSTNTTGEGAEREMTIKIYCRPPGG